MTAIQFGHQLDLSRSFLMNSALKFTRDRETAEDLVQETMLKALLNRKRYRDGTNLKGWLYTILRNTFITDFHKRERKHAYVNDRLNSAAREDYEAEMAGPSLMEQEIRQVLNALREEYREPVMMYAAGWKYHEIAEVIRIPVGTVKNRIHVARKLLKQKLGIYAGN